VAWDADNRELRAVLQGLYLKRCHAKLYLEVGGHWERAEIFLPMYITLVNHSRCMGRLEPCLLVSSVIFMREKQILDAPQFVQALQQLSIYGRRIDEHVLAVLSAYEIA